MRIGSTDATSVSILPAQERNIAVREIPVAANNGSQAAEFEKKEPPVDEKMVKSAIEKANRVISGYDRRFEYSIHEKTNEIMIKVIDINTNEVIREIPPEKILDLIAGLMEIAGLIVDERR